MRRRRLGSGGPELTVLGIGSWAMGGPYQFGWGPVDDEESVGAVRTALEAGVNWVDTAAVYGLGHAEEVVGRALEPYAVGEDVYVFTKCGRNWYGTQPGIAFDLRPESIRFECEQSLRRLGVERIDLYQFHWPDYGTGTPVEESWGTMADLQDEGKVRWIGVSNFDLELLERCEAVRHVDSLQPPFSLLNRHARAELIPGCRESGTGVIVYSPMASGLLTGAFDAERLERLPEDDWRRRGATFQEPAFSRSLALVERLRPTSDRHEVSVGAVAVAWTLAADGVTGAIVGARRPAQIDDWIEAGDLELTPQDLAEIEGAIEATGAGTKEAPTPPALQRR